MASRSRLFIGALALSASSFAAAPASAHSAYEVVEMLRDWGFNRIEVIDAHLPKYQFEACQRGDRYHLHADYYGTITEKHQIGSCRGEGRRYGGPSYDRYDDSYQDNYRN